MFMLHLVFHVSLLENYIVPLDNIDTNKSISYEEVPVDILD